MLHKKGVIFLKRNRRQEKPFACGASESTGFLPDFCRHSLCHGDRLSFDAGERAGGFDPVKAGGEADTAEEFPLYGGSK